MTHLLSSEFHAHRTSCLSGGEFPCPVALPPEPFDHLWDSALKPLGSDRRQSKYTEKPRPKKCLLLP